MQSHFTCLCQCAKAGGHGPPPPQRWRVWQVVTTNRRALLIPPGWFYFIFLPPVLLLAHVLVTAGGVKQYRQLIQVARVVQHNRMKVCFVSQHSLNSVEEIMGHRSKTTICSFVGRELQGALQNYLQQATCVHVCNQTFRIKVMLTWGTGTCTHSSAPASLTVPPLASCSLYRWEQVHTGGTLVNVVLPATSWIYNHLFFIAVQIDIVEV